MGTWVPADRKQQRRAEAPCPSKVRRHAPSARDHSRTVLSPLAVASACTRSRRRSCCVPLCWELKDVHEIQGGVRVSFGCTSLAQRRCTWSTGEKAACHTPRLCPRSVSTATSDGSFHTCGVHPKRWHVLICHIRVEVTLMLKCTVNVC